MFRIDWLKLPNILYYGYFVFPAMQNVEDSKAFFKRKIEFLTKQIEKIQPVLQEKHAMKQGKPGFLEKTNFPNYKFSHPFSCIINIFNIWLLTCCQFTKA